MKLLKCHYLVLHFPIWSSFDMSPHAMQCSLIVTLQVTHADLKLREEIALYNHIGLWVKFRL